MKTRGKGTAVAGSEDWEGAWGNPDVAGAAAGGLWFKAVKLPGQIFRLKLGYGFVEPDCGSELTGELGKTGWILITENGCIGFLTLTLGKLKNDGVEGIK